MNKDSSWKSFYCLGKLLAGVSFPSNEKGISWKNLNGRGKLLQGVSFPFNK